MKRNSRRLAGAAPVAVAAVELVALRAVAQVVAPAAVVALGLALVAVVGAAPPALVGVVGAAPPAPVAAGWEAEAVHRAPVAGAAGAVAAAHRGLVVAELAAVPREVERRLEGP